MSTALITGASAGLGVEFARQLAARGQDLVLVARSVDKMTVLADRLRSEHGVSVDVIGQDLAEPDAARKVAAEVSERGILVHTLVNNAGFGSLGRFEEITDGLEHDQLIVNVVALVDLTRALVPGMVARGSGAVVNVGSTAGFQPTPFFATYASGKAFVLNFSLALWSEYRGRGVKVLCLCPGPTDTSFFDSVGEGAVVGRMMAAGPVVAAALRGLDRGRPYVVPGVLNKVSAHLQPRRPRRVVTRIAHAVARSSVE